MKTTISVIIPCYHGNRYIPQLVQMLNSNALSLKKECGAALEVVFVNDSPEEKLIIEGESSFDMVVLNNPENSGIHATRVNGMKSCRGDYVQFLDQDDRITDRCLASQLSCIGDADMVIGNGYDGEPGGGRHLIYQDSSHHRAATDVRCHYYYNNLIRSPGQVLIRKTSVPTLWTQNILKNNGSDDAFLWILMLQNGCRAVINEEVVYEHIFTGSNASDNAATMLRSQMEVCRLLRGNASPVGMWAFRRRACYYCTSGAAHKIRYFDVGVLRRLYGNLFMKS